MEQLSGLDATFLYMESSTNYGHVGGLQVFRTAERPHWRTPQEEADHTEYLYSLASYTRRRLVEVPFGLDHPYWVEDPAFDREFHERSIGVPAPGTHQQLEQVVSRIASRPLDRSRPLWEVYLIEGVDEGRQFAIYSKTHHSAIDGASGHAARPGDDAADARAGQLPAAGDGVATRAGAVAGRDVGARAADDGAAPAEAGRAPAPGDPPDDRRAPWGPRGAAGAGAGAGDAQPAAHAGATHDLQPAHRPAPALRLRLDVAGRGPVDQGDVRLHGQRRRARPVLRAPCGRTSRRGASCPPSR